MQYGLLCVTVLPTGFYLLGARWGTVGLALVWVVVFPLLVLPAYRRVLQVIELSSGEYLRALWPAASASLIMGAAVVAVERSEEHTSELQSHSDLVCRLLLEKKKIPCDGRTGAGLSLRGQGLRWCDGREWAKLRRQ